MASIDLTQLRKAELHAHLNGCVPSHVISELVDLHHVVIPDGFKLPDDLIIAAPVKSLLEYFRPWNVFKRLPIGKTCLATMVDEALRSLAKDGIVYAELRNSPYNISELNNISLDESLLWLAETVEQSSARHGIEGRIVISFSRFRFDIERAQDLLSAIKRTNSSRRIVGLDLSGNEADPINPEVAHLFRRAKDEMGLHVTIHAGEVGGVHNVLWAIDDCKADRIGHALAAATEIRLLDLLAARRICVEVCLTSNLRTGSVQRLEDHAVHHFIAHGVPFVLCADNPAVHQLSLSDEYHLFLETTGREDLLLDMFATQMA